MKIFEICIFKVRAIIMIINSYQGGVLRSYIFEQNPSITFNYWILLLRNGNTSSRSIKFIRPKIRKEMRNFLLSARISLILLDLRFEVKGFSFSFLFHLIFLRFVTLLLLNRNTEFLRIRLNIQRDIKIFLPPS